MHITIAQGNCPPLPPSELNIVIDVIRAFTATQVAFEKGLSSVILVGSVAEAWATKKSLPDAVMGGEIGALKIQGFDFGNSPYEYARADLTGKDLIFKTTNGVTATIHALRTAQTLVASFANARQTASYVRFLSEQSPQIRVNIVASHPTGDEDLACAEYIRDILSNSLEVDPGQVAERIRKSENARKFLDPEQPQFDPRDIDLCAAERKGFVLLAAQEGRWTRIRRL